MSCPLIVVQQDQLGSLLRTAESLRVKGLAQASSGGGNGVGSGGGGGGNGDQGGGEQGPGTAFQTALQQQQQQQASSATTTTSSAIAHRKTPTPTSTTPPHNHQPSQHQPSTFSPPPPPLAGYSLGQAPPPPPALLPLFQNAAAALLSAATTVSTQKLADQKRKRGKRGTKWRREAMADNNDWPQSPQSICHYTIDYTCMLLLLVVHQSIDDNRRPLFLCCESTDRNRVAVGNRRPVNVGESVPRSNPNTPTTIRTAVVHHRPLSHLVLKMSLPW